MKIYLGGCRGKWREKIQAIPGVEGIDPFKGKEYALMDFTREDLDAIKESDMVIFHLTYHIFTGACVEAGYAYALKKPIILIFGQKGYIEPLLLAVSRKVFTDIDSAIEWLKEYLGRESK